MTREEALKLPRGTLLRTPFAPGTIVELVEVERETCMIRFTTDYQGYGKNSIGRYYTKELTPVAPNEGPQP